MSTRARLSPPLAKDPAWKNEAEWELHTPLRCLHLEEGWRKGKSREEGREG